MAGWGPKTTKKNQNPVYLPGTKVIIPVRVLEFQLIDPFQNRLRFLAEPFYRFRQFLLLPYWPCEW